MPRFLFLLCLFILPSFAKLTPDQIKNLQIVRDVARAYPDFRGETYENTLAAICITESSAGRDLIGDFKAGTDITKASLGAMQIQVRTAKYIASQFKTLRWVNRLNDANIANLLIRDIRFSAKIAAHYLKYLKKKRGKYFYVVSGYNGGWKNKKYYTKVVQNMTYVKKLVKKQVLK